MACLAVWIQYTCAYCVCSDGQMDTGRLVPRLRIASRGNNWMTTYAVVTTTIRLRFDGHSTRFRVFDWISKAIKCILINTGRWPAIHSHPDLAARSWRRSSNGRSGVESRSNRSCNHRLTGWAKLAAFLGDCDAIFDLTVTYQWTCFAD